MIMPPIELLESDADVFGLDIVVTPVEGIATPGRACATDDGCAATCASSCVSGA
ncbi:hypothetical protein GCM10027290_51590 [Micromonospora sonneratiae]|uniref:FxLD family lanthipeptide n=1 Tax=Micromonospora sonneratiae TaxID=1184706 RepID=A0ABW3YBW2_9ACTN